MSTNKEEWRSAVFYLPRANHCPVEVEFHDGKREKRDTTEGDWRKVNRWRPLEGTKKKAEK